MGLRKVIGRVARFIVSAQAEKNIKVNVSQVSYKNILSNKKIVITGGSRGIGYAMAKKFIAEGAKVIIVGRNEQRLKDSTKNLGKNCKYIKFDVNDIKNHKIFLESCFDMWGGGTIDILVSNAGISLHEGNFKNVTEESFDMTFNTNLKSNYFLCKTFLEMKLLEKDPNANLLIISSETGDQCFDIPYGLTKAALNSLTGALARRVYKYGIRVNAIAPGVTSTDMTSSYTNVKDGNMYSEGCASERIFLPEEIAEVACFLISDASNCISGEIIHCNAGNHLKTSWDKSE